MTSKLDLKALISNPPKLHKRGDELISYWRIDDTTCFELERHLSAGMKTLETGAGLSTIIFASNACRHTCIMPDQGLADRITAYCRANDIDTSGIDFIIASSADVIHQLKPEYDLALIDGSHGFPSAMVDFYYATKLLKIGGTLIIDDMHIFTCRLIATFMNEDAGWRMEVFTNRVAFATKIADTIGAEWDDQIFVTNRSVGDGAFKTPTEKLIAAMAMLRNKGIAATIARAAKEFRRI
jgi:hypothetical protein